MDKSCFNIPIGGLLFTSNITWNIYLPFLNWALDRKRPRLPPHVDANLSHANITNEDELDEEFDPLPSRRQVKFLNGDMIN